MCEVSIAEAVGARETLATEEVVEKCLVWHQEFDQKFWPEKDSFHNAEHIEATITAGEKLVEAALAGNDPLGIMDDLVKWNELHSDGQIKKKELSKVVKLTFAGHDLGNIAKEASIQPEGEIELVFLDQYKANGAEDRSQEIARGVIEASRITEEQRKRFLPLIQHLINETKFMPKEEVPFGVFARVVDQIGNDLFSTNRERVIGLLEEMCAENPYAEFPPYFLFNFARKRLEQLVPDKDKRTSLLEIWDKELPEEKVGLAQELTKVKEWLESQKTETGSFVVLAK